MFIRNDNLTLYGAINKMSIMKQIKTSLHKIWLLENTTMDNVKRIHKQHNIEFKMIDSWVNLSGNDFEKYRNIFYLHCIL